MKAWKSMFYLAALGTLASMPAYADSEAAVGTPDIYFNF